MVLGERSPAGGERSTLKWKTKREVSVNRLELMKLAAMPSVCRLFFEVTEKKKLFGQRRLAPNQG
jgi:hypothetical protein